MNALGGRADNSAAGNSGLVFGSGAGASQNRAGKCADGLDNDDDGSERSALAPLPRSVRQDTGIFFSGSTNGIGTTFAFRFPHSVSTVSVVPLAASAVGTQQ